MVQLWTLILITGGYAFPYETYTSKQSCYGVALEFYGEMMGKNQGEVICQSNDTGEIMYVTRAHDEINRQFREREKNPPPPRPWEEVEADYDYELAQCYKAGKPFEAKPKCEKIATRKREALKIYKEKGLL